MAVYFFYPGQTIPEVITVPKPTRKDQRNHGETTVPGRRKAPSESTKGKDEGDKKDNK